MEAMTERYLAHCVADGDRVPRVAAGATLDLERRALARLVEKGHAMNLVEGTDGDTVEMEVEVDLARFNF